jgi:hypothetical protein
MFTDGELETLPRWPQGRSLRIRWHNDHGSSSSAPMDYTEVAGVVGVHQATGYGASG